MIREMLKKEISKEFQNLLVGQRIDDYLFIRARQIARDVLSKHGLENYYSIDFTVSHNGQLAFRLAEESSYIGVSLTADPLGFEL